MCPRALPWGAARVPATGGAETHHSSLTQPGAAVWEVRQRPETCLEGGQALGTRTRPRERLPAGAFHGSRGHVASGESLHFIVPQFPRH